MNKLTIVLTELAIAVAITAAPTWADDNSNGVSGAWLSPDWILPGPHQYTSAETRTIIADTVAELAERGTNTIFFETWLRGYSIVPGIQHTANVTEVMPFTVKSTPDGTYDISGLPLYSHLQMPYEIVGREVQDPLQMLIDEARLYNIDVHAWCHAFYWKMDNTSVMPTWYSGPSAWNDLMAAWLNTQANKLAKSSTAAPATLALMQEAGQLYQTTSEDRELEKILNKHRIKHDGHPMGALIRECMRAGADAPDFLLISSSATPLPAPRGKTLRPVFLNPANSQVQKRLAYAIGNISRHHPGLRGIHLDHFRYPVDAQGLPPKLGITNGTDLFFRPSDKESLQRCHQAKEVLAYRESVLKKNAQLIRQNMDKRQQLSSAVLPLYYQERSNNQYKLNGCQYAAQGWYDWPVDFVVPMMYEFKPYFIRQLLRSFAEDQIQLFGKVNVEVIPGISHLQMAQQGGLNGADWIFFDLTLARDVKFEKQQIEDFSFTPQ